MCQDDSLLISEPAFDDVQPAITDETVVAVEGDQVAGHKQTAHDVLGRQAFPAVWLSWFLCGCFLHTGQTALAADRTDASSRLDAVTLKLKWQHQFQFAGYYAAVEKGFYREAGLDVTIVEASDYDESTDAVLKGEADFGIGASDLVVLRAKGSPVVVLAAVFQHSPLVLVTKQNAGINHVHELAGKRVMLEPHADELVAYLKNEGISTSQLVLCPHVFDASHLIDDKVDAMSAYTTDEPYALEEAGIQYQVFSPRSGGIDFYGDTLFTTEEQIEKHPERVRAFLSASLRGWQYAFDHVDEMIDVVIPRYGTRHSPEHLRYEAEKMRQLVIPDIIEVGYMNPGRWEHIANTYAELGMIPEGFSLEGFLYTEQPQSDSRWIYVAIGAVSVVLVLLVLVAVAGNTRRLLRNWRRSSRDT